MHTRPTAIVSGVVALAVVAAIVYFWTAHKDGAEGQPDPVSGGAIAPSGSAPEGSVGAGSETPSGETGESLETIMQEIERDAAGDDRAMEDELAGESESFMEGAVVMEQLGQSYDETGY